MLKVSVSFFVFLSGLVFLWLTLSDQGGYTSRSATIVARSTPIVSTIDGQVTFVTPAVGSKVTAGSLLATIQNNRIDRSHLTELLGKEAYLEWEVDGAEALSSELDMMKGQFAERADAYWNWTQKDLEILRRQTESRFLAAKETHAQKLLEIERQKLLLEGSTVDDVVWGLQESEAAVALHEMQAIGAELDRIDLKIAASASSGVMAREANYWDEASDEIFLNVIESKQKVVSTRAQLHDIKEQISVEAERLQANFMEEHTVQFDGIVNAVLTNKDELIAAGTTMLEVLDCNNPIAIVSIPEHRFGEFFNGQKATIKPFDSDQELVGTVQHISSGPLISRDTSIAAHPDLALDGNKIIVAFDNTQETGFQNAAFEVPSCDTARRAVVTIETETLLGKGRSMVAGFFEEVEIMISGIFAQPNLVSRPANAAS